MIHIINLIVHLIERLQFTEAFQFDTDTTLPECARRLTALEQSGTQQHFHDSVRLTPLLPDRYRFEIRRHFHSLALPATCLYAGGILWVDDGITFVNGETRLTNRPSHLAIAPLFLLSLIPLLTPALMTIVALLLIVSSGFIVWLWRALEERTILVNGINDLLDHELSHRTTAARIP